jgi:hypothetical protein
MEFQNYPPGMVLIKAGQTEVNQQQIINQFQFGSGQATFGINSKP